MESLYYIRPETDSGPHNMIIDEKLMALSRKEGKSFFRLYHWDPVCISLGRGQSPESLLNMDYIESKGYQCINRITGGSYVLHKGDITYAITVSSKSSMFSLSLIDLYKKVHNAFYKAIISSGIDKGLVYFGSGSFRREHKQLPCFSHYSNNELLLEGKKILGSAQKRGKDSLLQHGSLLVENSLYDLFRIQKTYAEFSEIERSITYIRKYTDISYEDLYMRIINAIGEEFNQKIIIAELKEVLENLS